VWGKKNLKTPRIPQLSAHAKPRTLGHTIFESLRAVPGRFEGPKAKDKVGFGEQGAPRRGNSQCGVRALFAVFESEEV